MPGQRRGRRPPLPLERGCRTVGLADQLAGVLASQGSWGPGAFESVAPPLRCGVAALWPPPRCSSPLRVFRCSTAFPGGRPEAADQNIVMPDSGAVTGAARGRLPPWRFAAREHRCCLVARQCSARAGWRCRRPCPRRSGKPPDCRSMQRPRSLLEVGVLQSSPPPWWSVGAPAQPCFPPEDPPRAAEGRPLPCEGESAGWPAWWRTCRDGPRCRGAPFTHSPDDLDAALVQGRATWNIDEMACNTVPTNDVRAT